ncbi:primosomal protein N' [Patescibacteria group bacterium]|nr:primosomal protein N' [Patescibacteria group bacterium]MBU1922241.1 primosomal protein N' [Patescibacteria group bacterium]
MYAEVIPNLRLPLNFDVFDYLIPDELAKKISSGVLVTIPYRSRDILGLVYKTKPHTEFGTKKILPIKSTVLEGAVFDECDLGLIDFVSKYYLVSKSSVFKALMPEIPKREVKMVDEDGLNTLDFKFEKKDIDLVFKELTDGSQLLVYQNKLDFLQNIQELISKFRSQGQVIILEPQISHVKNTALFFSQELGNKVSVLHSGLGKGVYWKNWLDFAQGRTSVLVGTRAAIFTPTKNLKAIIIADEESADFKQYDQNPRYDARRLALWISRKRKISAIFASQAPSLNTWHAARQDDWPVVKIPGQADAEKIIIDLEEERRARNFALVSEKLKQASNQALQAGKKVLLFFNRRGYATSVVCQDCGFTYLCPQCSIPLATHQNRLYCHHCALQQDMPLKCAKCESMRIKISGAGIEKLEQEIKSWASEYKILRLDKESARGQRHDLKSFDIILGTNFVLKDYYYELLDPELSLAVMGVINSDSLFNIPDFRSVERLWQELTKIENLSGVNQTRLFIQTLRPENEVLVSLGKMNAFYEKELGARKVFKYPPINRLVKIVLPDKDRSQCAQKTNRVFEKLKSMVDKERIELLGPYPLFPERVRALYRFCILLKMDKNEPHDFLKNVFQENMIIDVDPEFTLN